MFLYLGKKKNTRGIMSASLVYVRAKIKRLSDSSQVFFDSPTVKSNMSASYVSKNWSEQQELPVIIRVDLCPSAVMFHWKMSVNKRWRWCLYGRNNSTQSMNLIINTTDKKRKLTAVDFNLPMRIKQYKLGGCKLDTKVVHSAFSS